MSFQYHEPTSLTDASRLGTTYGADGCFLAGVAVIMYSPR